MWGAAAKLGDDEARQALEALQADPRWAQVQVLGDLARHTVSQTESLAPVDAVDSGIWGMLKTEPETGRQTLDTGIDSHLPDDAEAKLLNELLAKPEGKDFEASLNSEDLAVLGAFKDLPPLDSLSAEPAEAAAGEAHAAADASAEQASVADELAPAEADAAAADAQLPAVFAPEPPPKRKPWWKFWAR